MEERSFICWFTPQITTMAKAGPGQSQEPGAYSRPATRMAGAQPLGPYFTAFSIPLARRWIKSRISTQIRHQSCRQWYYMLCHSVSYKADNLESSERKVICPVKRFLNEIVMWLLIWNYRSHKAIDKSY